MMEKIRIGTVIMGTRSTDVSLTHVFAKKSKLHQRWNFAHSQSIGIS
jgi:hypothetical protein